MAAMASQCLFFIFFWGLLLSCSSDPLIPTVITVPAAATPITNPVTTPPANANPLSPDVITPPAATTAQGGQRWCVANEGASNASLQAALNYACGIAGICDQIQRDGSCYMPNTLQDHASYAFNSYYQKNPTPTSCDFQGAATITTTNPSTGNCVYPAASGSPSSAPQFPQMSPPSTTPPPSIPLPTPTTMPTPILTPTTTPSPLQGGVPMTGTTFPPTFPNMTNPTIATPSGQMPNISPLGPSSISISTLLQPALGPIFVVSSFYINTLALKI